jgi:soluble lytic murein transglycosylase
MSSMHRTSFIAALLASALTTSTPLAAQEGPVGSLNVTQSGHDWDGARASLVARAPGPMAGAISRWEQLIASNTLPFDSYASFLVSYPGFPDEDRLRSAAEARLGAEFVPQDRLIAYFDRVPPLTNNGRAQYALALMTARPAEAQAMAITAWRGGEMTDGAESMIRGTYFAALSQADHDARMDALLWQRNRPAAERQLSLTSPQRQGLFGARLAILQGGEGATSDPTALSDPGYLYNRSRLLRSKGRVQEAAALLARRPQLSALPFDETLWVEEQLAVARQAGASNARAIATLIDDAFPAGADISAKGFKLRDDYTSLMWLGGTQSLWDLGDPGAAAGLFYRYGAAARTPQTRSKGFFWAGHAASRAGNSAGATAYYEQAGAFADKFYGQMALQALGRPLPNLAGLPQGAPTPEERAAFHARPITQAVAEVARDAPWRTGIRFYRSIADQATTMGEHLLVAELAQSIGRRDLAVNLADAAAADGHAGFVQLGFPTLETPQGTNWTVVHAIARQESQFAQNAISHAGARGLMQLMPGTAREEAEKAGISYMQASLIEDPAYNVRLGSNHFDRLMVRYSSYPLAIAAYNAGPGNVNKWLAANGDPRRGSISWIDWIEKIPFTETRNYVTRVLENAVVYESLYPQQAPQARPRGVDEFLR